MPIENKSARRSKRYYLVAGAIIVLINVVAFVYSDQALWPMVLAGTLFGGFLVDAVVDQRIRLSAGVARAEHDSPQPADEA